MRNCDECEEVIRLRRQVEELEADNAMMVEKVNTVLYRCECYRGIAGNPNWGHDSFEYRYLKEGMDSPHPGATLLKERDELRARTGIAEKALGLACGWLAEEKLQGCSTNHPLVLKAKDQMKHGALSQAKATE